VRPGETVVDATFGAGGHARVLAADLRGKGRFIAVDRDASVRPYFESFERDAGVQARFLRGELSVVLTQLGSNGVEADAILLDLGVSSMQIDRPERGFSYAVDAPLDMRMDPSGELSAREIVNEWDERTGELVDTVKSAIPAPRRFGDGHPAKRVFQALRIAVNEELDALERALPAALAMLRPGGRLAVISFHSLEDRMVKRFFAAQARGCTCPPELPVCVCGHEPTMRLLTRKAVRPSPQETAENPRSASAKLRAAAKVGD
jgi:16S rRNA (cytosine1402-N4)-methyltransferase